MTLALVSPPIARSPQRAALFGVIEEVREIRKRQAFVADALQKAQDNLRKAKVRLDTLAGEERDAKAQAVRAVTAGKHGDAVKQLGSRRTSKAQIEDEIEVFESAIAELEDEAGVFAAVLQAKGWRLDDAIIEVVKAAPETTALLERFSVLYREFENIRRAVGFLQTGSSSPTNKFLTAEQAAHGIMNPDSWSETPLSAAWRAAVAALREDADAKLPDLSIGPDVIVGDAA